MKKLYVLFYFSFCILNSVFAQSGTWTWISGDNAANAVSVGTLGSISINNHPPCLYEAQSWTDKQGNFWLYGGFTVVADTAVNNTELWEYLPATGQWKWVKGGISDALHGAKGVVSAANTPGSRTYSFAAWVDTSGDFWLYGGAGHGDDLWKFTLSNQQWLWVRGDTTPNKAPVHGVMGTGTALTTPGNRYSTSSAWTDAENNLWVFGGFGAEDDSALGGLNDLWKYNIHDSIWTWMKGSQYINPVSTYNALQTPNPASTPGERFTNTCWKDSSGNFWLFGGFDYNEAFAYRNDVWEYDLGLDDWIWMAGPDTGNGVGDYNATCAYNNLNTPFSRNDNASSATGNCSRFWMFGGGGVDAFAPGFFNDLWVFDPDQKQWNLVKGYGQQPGVYGTKGVGAAANIPAPRGGAVAWWGNDNKFYLFSGEDGSQLYADMWVFTPDTNCVGSCRVAPPPPPTLPVAGFTVDKTTLCGSYCVNFSDTSTNETSRKWKFLGITDSISMEQNPHVCYSAEGTYSVTLIAYNADGNDSITKGDYITVVPLPPAPNLKQQDSTLYFHPDPSYLNYQWYDGDAVLNGKTDTFLVVIASGSYYVQITAVNGCKVEIGTIVEVGIEDYIWHNSTTLSPNPAGNELRIKNEELRIGKIEIYNTLGQQLYQSVITSQETVMDISNLPQGIYFLQMQWQSGSEVLKFIKE